MAEEHEIVTVRAGQIRFALTDAKVLAALDEGERRQRDFDERFHPGRPPRHGVSTADVTRMVLRYLPAELNLKPSDIRVAHRLGLLAESGLVEKTGESRHVGSLWARVGEALDHGDLQLDLALRVVTAKRYSAGMKDRSA